MFFDYLLPFGLDVVVFIPASDLVHCSIDGDNFLPDVLFDSIGDSFGGVFELPPDFSKLSASLVQLSVVTQVYFFSEPVLKIKDIVFE